jgi:hypothetical protein
MLLIFGLFFTALQVGSVDEESTKSDEEYDDLAMQDGMENGYWSDDDDYELRSKLVEELGAKLHGHKYHQNLDQFLRTRSEPVPIEMVSQEPFCSYSSLLVEKSDRKVTSNGKAKFRKRSLSIPALGKHSSAINDPILSGTPQR